MFFILCVQSCISVLNTTRHTTALFLHIHVYIIGIPIYTVLPHLVIDVYVCMCKRKLIKVWSLCCAAYVVYISQSTWFQLCFCVIYRVLLCLFNMKTKAKLHVHVTAWHSLYMYKHMQCLLCWVFVLSRLVMSLEGEVTVREEEEEEEGGGTELMGSTVTDGSYIREKWEKESEEDV